MDTTNPATTTTTHRVTTPDGRTLAVDVTGPAAGPVLVFLHSAPGSRRFDPDPAATAAAGVRLVTFDRAGYGESVPFADDVVPTIGRHAADAATVVESLDAGPVDVVGWSAGGRIGVALAAARPELVRSIAVVATPAPDAEVPWAGEEHRAMSAELRTDPGTAMAAMRQAFAGFDAAIAGDDDVAVSQVAGGTADEALLASRPDLRAAVAQMVQAGCAPGTEGLAADIVADQVADWDLDPSAVSAPASCWYGADDDTVGPVHGDWWADRIPGATRHVEAGVGHLVIATAWPAILARRPRA